MAADPRYAVRPSQRAGRPVLRFYWWKNALTQARYEARTTGRGCWVHHVWTDRAVYVAPDGTTDGNLAHMDPVLA